MNSKNFWPETDVAKHKKKSKAKGLARANHKHQYEVVLLSRDFHTQNFSNGKPSIMTSVFPTKVCLICGRIGDSVIDEEYFVRTKVDRLPFTAYNKQLSEKALQLPKWYADDYFDKFAHQ